MARASTSDPFTGWKLYPLNLPADVLIGVDASEYGRELTKRSSTLFSNRTDVNIFDSHGLRSNVASPASTLPRSIQDQASLEQLLSETSRPQMRIISISQENSLGPFAISEELMRKVLTKYAAPPRFLDVLFGVSGNTKFAEEAYGAAVFVKTAKPIVACDISYQFKFVERNSHTNGSSPWSIRQLEVFNRASKPATSSRSREDNLWLLLTPTPNSKAENEIEQALHEDSSAASCYVRNPLRLHLKIISAYIDNWRQYLDYEGQIYQAQRKFMLTTDFEDDEDFNASMNFDAMLTLRNLQDRLLSIPIVLEATLVTIDALKTMNVDLQLNGIIDVVERDLVEHALGSIKSRVTAHLGSAKLLQKRVEGVESLLADGLSMRNQVIAATNQKVAAQNQQVATDISERLYKLTLDSVDDSAYVQLVSLATLMYLPGSFIASLFGMDFFAFSSSSRLEMASDIWIYVLFTIPLTVLTVACWWFASRASRKQRHKRAEARKLGLP